MFRTVLPALLLFALAAPLATCAETPAERGYRLLLEKPYLPADFDESLLADVWQAWPEPLRSEAEKATPAERRQMAFRRYGITPRPGEESGLPLQYVVRDDGGWSMNCFACHGGRVDGKVIPGSPNTHFMLQSLTEELRHIKLDRGTLPGRLDVASLLFPLGGHRGGTNAVMFGVILMAQRDAELNVVPYRPPQLARHDMEPPPLGHFRKRKALYVGGFGDKSPRALMPFVMVKQNSGETMRGWEADFADIYAYLESLEPPKYPYPVDEKLAAEGRLLFNRNCAECHGTYGENPTYPQEVVPLEVIGTDPVRLRGLSREHRERYRESWLAHYGDDRVDTEPAGYLAPPLDGLWASAPYFHNGSVPTLAHLLELEPRPTVWRRDLEGYDRERIGLPVETFETIPTDVSHPHERREFYDTRRPGNSSAGHAFFDPLTPTDRRAVLEYLKTL